VRREKIGANLPADTRAYEYGQGTASEGKGDRQTMRKSSAMDSKEVQKHESAFDAENNEVEDIELLDDIEISELIELMEVDDSVDTISQRLEEDDDSESVQRSYVNPRHMVPKAKKPRYISKRTFTSEETKEETTIVKSRWLISSCRSCGDIIRFRADQPQPPTCGKPQCIERFEERNKNKVAL